MQNSVASQITRRVLPWLGWAAGTLAAFTLITRIPLTATIFALAALFAFGVAPITRDLERRMPRTAAVAIVYASLLVCFVVLIVLVVPSAIAQAQSVIRSAPDFIDSTQSAFASLDRHLQGRLGPSYTLGLEQLRTIFTARVDAFAGTAVASLTSMLFQTVTAIFVILSSLVLSAFFISRAESLAAGFRGLFAPKYRHLAAEFEHELARVFGSFIAGQALLCAITGGAVWIVLSMLGAPFAVLGGVAAGFGYAVPFIGMFVVQIAAAILALPDGWPMVARVSIAIFAIARIVDTLVVPKVMSESVGVSPIAIMFAVFAGGELFGGVGLLMGIPVAALAKTLWSIFLRARAEREEIVALPPL